MAAPHVGGAAALFLNNNPTATPAQTWSAITRSTWVSANPFLTVPAGTSAKGLYVATL
jgi:subtilisin family serine protease